MVVMESEKYPNENDFKGFISLNGGTTYAATDCEHTRFYFDIPDAQLLSALIPFSVTFNKKIPIKKEAVTREREVIQKEFQLGLSSDKNRKELLLSFIARTGHPASKFLRGNSIALNNDIDDDKLYEALHIFRERHYSPHRMTLAIQARLPLDTLAEYVQICFSDLQSNCEPSDNFAEFKDGDSFDTDGFQRMFKQIKPMKDIMQLHVTWALPSLLNLYRSKPSKYISWIIEHKGSGSLTSYLRKKKWGLDVFCGNCGNDNGFGNNSMYVLFEIVVELTQEGAIHRQDVLDAIFSFIKLVKSTGPQESIYTELYKIGNNNFRFFSKHDDVFDLCMSMHFYQPCDYLTGKHLYFEYNPEAVQKCLDFLVPETAMIMIFNYDYKLHIVEPDFKINYRDISLPKEFIERWKSIEPLSDFQLPLRNEFLTNNFSILPVSAEAPKYPVKIHHDCMSEIWFCPKFHWPMCHINLHIIAFLNGPVPRNAVNLQLYCNVLKYLSLEELHPAVTAGFAYKIDVNEAGTGITIQTSGFNEHLSSWLMNIANYLVGLVPISKDLFKIIKMQQFKKYYNKFTEPEKFIEDVKLWILKWDSYTHVNKYNSLRLCSYESFQNFVKSFTNNLYIQCLAEGNVTKDFTINIIQEFIQKINYNSLKNRTFFVYGNKIPRHTSYLKLKNINRTDSNSIVTNYYQVDSATIELSVLIQLMLMLMKESLMNHIRTQEKLSYVSCKFNDIYGVLGYSITLCTQADKCTTEYVDQQIEEFLNSFRIVLEQFSEKKLDDVKEGLKISKQHDDAETLKNRVNRHWSEITKQQYMFDRCEKEALALKDININKLKQFFRRHTLDGSSFRKLSVHVVGTPKEVTVNAENRRRYYSIEELIINDSQYNTATDHHITDINHYKFISCSRLVRSYYK
ncbi:PREDICTED: nardilysin-like [Trachymyrmex cornetzi]|uniref:nardilysin-like n=1 Tax=Trachymyrmex cornetzi TaxID=471704 RepID=UPI00084F17A7|nr:PREDICTED: nardilysin-like [Trachymyrmex cornetzi]